MPCRCSTRQCALCSVYFLCCGAASRHGMARLVTARLRFVNGTCVTVGYDANERRDGDQWPAGRSNAVLPRLVAARATPHLHSESFVCSTLVLASCSRSPRQCVLCSARFLCAGAASLHGMARRFSSRCGCGLLTLRLVWLLLRRGCMTRWRPMACGTNACSYATVGGGYSNDASA